ncbi:hypothetical protein GOBAR_AA01909 [Gossypium barbadense]|uniref:Uncharacterized protein n=1 Tax=Gossypium barbadense TaxID=3634 RepID=A0A2P5YSU4_GOSBA|nr:hypothetical protein GOBAR_AA01909 [Gossypium barbadense]
MSVLEFGAAMRLYTEEFMSTEDFLRLHRHIHHSPSCYWIDLTSSQTPYDPSRLKVTSLSPTLRYIDALLAYRPLRDSPRLTLRSPRYIGAVLHTHTSRPDVPSGHIEHDIHQDD